MNKSPESPILSDEHYKFLQLDQVKRSPVERPAGKPATEAVPVISDDQSLREFNAELLQKIGEYRKRNLEFSSSENAVRSEMAAQAKRFADRERELSAKFQKEIDALKKSLEDQSIAHEHAGQEWNRKLAKLSDESWAKGLEIESMRRAESEHEAKFSLLQEQIAKSNAQVSSLQHDLSAALESEEALRQETNETAKILLALEQAMEQNKNEMQTTLALANQQSAQAQANFHQRESQLITAFDALRGEYSNIDTCYREANETITLIHAELRARDEAHQAALNEQERSLRAAYLSENQATLSENAKLREMLSVRETRLDTDRAALQTWREQLGFLDQHLRQQGDSVKKEKGELLRAAKIVAEEIEFSLQNPFTEYLEIAEKEVAHIEVQLANTSSMSPLRPKLEVRLTSARSHRDGINGILEEAKAGLQEHVKIVASVLKNLESMST